MEKTMIHSTKFTLLPTDKQPNINKMTNYVTMSVMKGTKSLTNIQIFLLICIVSLRSKKGIFN